jgi:hypothetical protein
MSKIENLDNQMFQALTAKESDAVLGGAFTFVGLTDRNGTEYNDYASGDAVVPVEQDQIA